MNCSVCGKPVKKQGLTTWNFGICQRSKACRAAYARALNAVKRPPDPPPKHCESCGKQLHRLQWANAKSRFCASKACQAAAHRIYRDEARPPQCYCNWPECGTKIQTPRNKSGYCTRHLVRGVKAERIEAERKATLERTEAAAETAAKAAKRARENAWHQARAERLTAQIEAAKQASTLEEKARTLADSPEEEGEMLAALTAHERFKAERAERIRKRELKAARLKAMAGA